MQVSEDGDGATCTGRYVKHVVGRTQVVQSLEVEAVDTPRTLADRSVRDDEELVCHYRLPVAVNTETVGDGAFTVNVQARRFRVETDEQLGNAIQCAGHDTIFAAACDPRTMGVTIIDGRRRFEMSINHSPGAAIAGHAISQEANAPQ